MTIAFRQAAQAAAFLLVALLPPALASSTPTHRWTVDCSRGQSITHVLEHAPPGFKLTLTVRGTCNEAVVIERDDVTLRGDAVTGAVINAPRLEIGITVRAMRVLIDRMTVQGGSDGIMVYGVMDTYVTNTTIRDVARWGLVSKNAHTFVTGCTIVGSGQDGISLQRGSARLIDCEIRANRGAGIGGGNASGLNISGSTVASNSSAGIVLGNGSQATIHDNNTITSNGFNPEFAGAGVNVSGASNAQISGSSIANNAGAGLHVAEGSVATASNNTITGNGGNGVLASENSHVSLWSNTIDTNGTNVANDVNNRNGVAAFFSNLNLGGNQVTNHPAAGVRVIVSSFNGGGNTISGNSDGVLAYNAKLVVHPGDTIVDNRNFGLLLNQTSSAQVAGARIQNNASDGILLQWASTLVLVDPATTSGGNGGYGLRCPDAKSSVVGLQLLLASPPNGQGGVSPTCTGF